MAQDSGPEIIDVNRAARVLPLSIRDLHGYRDSLLPVWVFDIDEARIIWANPAAVTLWDAASADELLARDLSQDMSSSARARLSQHQAAFWQSAHFDEPWTIYPNGNPRALLCRFRGCLTEGGRMAMLCEGQPMDSGQSELMRSAQALLYTGVMVTTYSAAGLCTYANPAARRAFPTTEAATLDRFLEPAVRGLFGAAAADGLEGTYLSAVATAYGVRMHEVEVRHSYDPLDGSRNFLITEVDVTRQEAARRELSILATRDSLTGLHNRSYLASSSEAFLKTAAQRGHVAALLLLDIDRFKFVNDTLGHSTGDALLQEIGRRMLAVLPENALLSRLGGDEFCCLLSAPAGDRTFLRVGGAILKDLRRPLVVDNYDLSVFASIGVSQSDGATTDFDEMLRKADLALFDAKANGGNTVRLFRPELAARSQRFLQIDTELREALARNRLELYYQPRISFRTGRIVAAEALIRLNSPTGSQVLPGEFIPVAEITGRIAATGRWVLREAVRHLQALRQAGSPIDLSVNVSPKQFADPSFLALLRQVRPTIDALKGEIELEITESVLLESDRRLQRILMQISDMGYKLAIDDFGTAYSNLASLTRFPISCIKVDRTLTCHKDFRLLVTGAMTIARAFGARIVAEGVETAEQHDWLKENLCDEFQGYYFSRPVPFAELQKMVAVDLQRVGG